MNIKSTSMDLAFLARVRRTSLIVAAVAAIPVATYWGLWMGAAWLAGVVWSLVNLLFIGEVVKNVITAEDRNSLKILAAATIKFPVLYAIGFFLLWNGKLPAAGLVAGFSWPFAVMILKAIGRAYLRLDESTDSSRDELKSDERSNEEGKPSQA